MLLGYFKKVESQFQQVWQQPLTVVRSGRDVEAHVHLRAAADGTVESLTLFKPLATTRWINRSRRRCAAFARSSARPLRC